MDVILVSDVGLEPTRARHKNLNLGCLPIPPIRQMGQGAEALLSTNSFFFTGIHRYDNQPGMVYIYEKLIRIKPRATFYASSALSGFGKFFLTLGGTYRT